MAILGSCLLGNTAGSSVLVLCRFLSSCSTKGGPPSDCCSCILATGFSDALISLLSASGLLAGFLSWPQAGFKSGFTSGLAPSCLPEGQSSSFTSVAPASILTGFKPGVLARGSMARRGRLAFDS